MVLASTGVSTEEQEVKNGCCQSLSLQEESQLPPASPRCSPRSARSDPGVFQTTTSVLGPRACKILHTLRVKFPIALWFFQSKLSLFSKPDFLGGLSSKCRIPGLRCPMWHLGLLVLGENFYSHDFPPICGSMTWGHGS